MVYARRNYQRNLKNEIFRIPLIIGFPFLDSATQNVSTLPTRNGVSEKNKRIIMSWKPVHCSLDRESKIEQNRWNSDDWWRRDNWVFILRLIDSNIIVIPRARRIWVARREKHDDESTCCHRRSRRCDAVHKVARRQLAHIVDIPSQI